MKHNLSYKLISNFIEIYLGKNEYSLIKKVIKRVDHIENDFSVKILCLYKFFLLSDTFSNTFKDTDEVTRAFTFCFNKELKQQNLFNFKKLFLGSFDGIERLLVILDKMFYLELEEAFVYYLFAQKQLSRFYKREITLPNNFKELWLRYKEDIDRAYFFKPFFDSIFKCQNYDLRNEFIQYIHSKKETYLVNGIESIFLFGSVNDDTYCEDSDFDLAITFNKVLTYEDEKRIKGFLAVDIFKKFNRLSDIHRYVDLQESKEFLELNLFKIY